MKRILVVLSVALGLAAAVSSEDDEAVRAVAALDSLRQRALVENDHATLDRILAPGMTYTHSIGLQQDREQIYAMLDGGDVAYRGFTVHDLTWRVFGATVVGVGSQTVALTVDGRETASRSRFTVVYARIGPAWKCVAYQSTPLPEVKQRQKIR